ncbi:pentapeptide repeat-containing protein [Catenovulum sp. SM1970]|nr:pentapeptide repeat-containing protein [Marinifaba aquimaris]
MIWYAESEDRLKAKHYTAWQVINSANGSIGDGGRIHALQDLNSDEVDLTAVSLANAYLKGLNLVGADLHQADLRHADLQDADFTCADLSGADLTGANLTGAKFKYAYLYGAKLDQSHLANTDFTQANLYHASLLKLSKNEPILQGTSLCEAVLADQSFGACIDYDDQQRKQFCQTYRGNRVDRSETKSGWMQSDWQRAQAN